LFVKSFCDASLPGTSIRQEGPRKLVPIFILKTKQLFMTLSPRDFSFIAEDNLSEIFGLFSRFRVKINLMQSSALNFSACVDSRDEVYKLMDVLKERFSLKYNTDVELLTIRHYNSTAISERTDGREIIDSQISRNTARFVLRVAE
jgi:aspartate kinase